MPLALGSYRHRDLPVSAQRLLNWMPEAEPVEAKARVVLLPTPGLSPFAVLSQPACRGLAVMGSYLYVLNGEVVFRVDENGAWAVLGTIPGSLPVTLDDNGTQLVVVTPEDGRGWIVTETTVTQISDADFPAASSVTFVDGYHIVSQTDSTRFYISALNDPTSWDGLDFASAEGSPDNIVRAMRVGRELWLFGEISTEIWSNTGAADFPFQRITGAFVDRGCAARDSVAQRLGVPYWLGDDRCVYRAEGGRPTRISTHAQEQAIAGYPIVSDARGFVYEQEGHTFYVLTFPDAGATWVYDATTQAWHERSSEGYAIWRCVAAATFAGAVIGADYLTSDVYVVDPTANAELGAEIVRQATGRPMHQEGRRVRYDLFRADFVTGVGAASGQGSNPQVWLSWSDDGGRTFGSELWRGLGALGQYQARAQWRRLGMARDRVFRLQISDPVRATLIAVDLDAEPMAT